MMPISVRPILCSNSIVATGNFRMTFDVSWAFTTGSDSQAVNTESSQVPGLTYRFQGSMNIHRGTGVSATVTVHCFVFLVFYIRCRSKYNLASVMVFNVTCNDI